MARLWVIVEKNTRGRIAIAICQKTTLLFKQPRRGSVIVEYRNSGQETKHKDATAMGCSRETACSCKEKFRSKKLLTEPCI